MFRSIARKAISFILVLAMLSEVSAPLAYAAGNSPHSGTSGPEGISVERLYDPDKQLEGESADISLDETVAGVVNNISKGDVLEASNDTVLFENAAKRDVNAKGYRLTDGSDSVLMIL